MGAFRFDNNTNNEKVGTAFDFGLNETQTNSADQNAMEFTTGQENNEENPDDYQEYEYADAEETYEFESTKTKRQPLILEEYPDSYLFRTGELARYLDAKEQTVRNVMKMYLDKYINPETDNKGRKYTKEQMIKIADIYSVWSDRGISWPEIDRMLASEMGAVHTAKDNLAAGEEMAKQIKNWIEIALSKHSSAIALEDKQMLEALTNKLDDNEKAITELKESIKLQEAAMRNQAEAFQEIITAQSRSAKEQAEMLKELQQQNTILQEQNNLLLKQTEKKKKFSFFKK